MNKSAIISDDEVYRYVLRRVWDVSKPTVAFIGLNPSTADASKDDPTIGRCIAFATSWGFGGLTMLNLFAYRSTEPTGLLTVNDPVGPDNNAYLLAEKHKNALIIAAWGNGLVIRRADSGQTDFVKNLFDNLCYLRLNIDGTPGHPLYLRGDTVPKAWQYERDGL